MYRTYNNPEQYSIVVPQIGPSTHGSGFPELGTSHTQRKHPISPARRQHPRPSRFSSSEHLSPVNPRNWRPKEDFVQQNNSISTNELANSLAELAARIGDSPVDATVEGGALLDSNADNLLQDWSEKYGDVFEDLCYTALAAEAPDEGCEFLKQNECVLGCF